MTCNDAMWPGWKPSLTEIKSFLFSRSWPSSASSGCLPSCQMQWVQGAYWAGRCWFLVINFFSVGSINGLIHDRILNLGGRKMLAKLQCSLIQSIVFGSCAGGGCWKYKPANPNTVKKWCVSQKFNRGDCDLICIVHSSGMNLHKVQRRKKGILCVCESHTIWKTRSPLSLNHLRPLFGMGEPLLGGDHNVPNERSGRESLPFSDVPNLLQFQMFIWREFFSLKTWQKSLLIVLMSFPWQIPSRILCLPHFL